MSIKDLHLIHPDHTFDQDRKRPAERRTIVVIALTTIMMVVEISAGIIYGSMALLADGLHMASHAVALSVSAAAYIYARRHARDRRYSFGTGKVNALGGFTGAILLALFAFFMGWKSLGRLIEPVDIVFNQAILVAVLGLTVNGVSFFILGAHDEHHHASDHGTTHHDHEDHNLKSAYLHVLADALTSILAIFALLMAKHFGYVWMDPLMGIIGMILVARWSFGLLHSTVLILLDQQGPEAIRNKIVEIMEADNDCRVVDLHLWSIGTAIYATELVIVTYKPATPEDYKARIPDDLGLVHVTIEIHPCLADEKKCAMVSPSA